MVYSKDGNLVFQQRNLKKRFLIAGTSSFPENGGAPARAMHMQAKGLVELGHEVTVATCEGTLPPNQTLFDGIRVVSFVNRISKNQGAGRGSWLWAAAQLRLLIYLMLAVAQKRFDYIIFYGVAPIFVPISLVGALFNNDTCLVQGDLLYKRKDVIWYYVTSERILAKTVKWIIAIGSSLLIEHFKRIAPGVPVIRTWPPTDVSFYHNGDGSRARAKYHCADKKVVVYAGAINSLEGIDILLAATKMLLKRNRDVRLVLAGRIAEKDPTHGHPFDCQGIIAKLGLAERVVLTGFLSMQEVADLLSAADVLVNPKIDHILNRVAAPIKVGEILASGRPVVSTRVCDLETWLHDRQEVLFCDPGDPEQLCARIEELLDNQGLAEQIAQGGYLAAKRKCHYTIWASEVLGLLEKGR